MKCDILFKATKVDGIYIPDPVINKNAKKLYDLTYDYVINNELRLWIQHQYLLLRRMKSQFGFLNTRKNSYEI